MIEGVSIEMSLESAMSKSLGNRHFCFISNTLQAAACMHGCLGLMNACRMQQCSWMQRSSASVYTILSRPSVLPALLLALQAASISQPRISEPSLLSCLVGSLYPAKTQTYHPSICTCMHESFNSLSCCEVSCFVWSSVCVCVWSSKLDQ